MRLTLLIGNYSHSQGFLEEALLYNLGGIFNISITSVICMFLHNYRSTVSAKNIYWTITDVLMGLFMEVRSIIRPYKHSFPT